MKKILITGKNSYIGTSLEKWLSKEPEKYKVNSLSTRDEAWKKKDFSYYDVVFHVAGIAHIKETKKNEALYYKVNRDLAFEIAQKAKRDDVKQFVFLSSMSVYGMDEGVIYKNTLPNPKSAYGKSKLEAEKLIQSLQDNSFTVTIVRPPMVYGKGCKGNYPRLAKLALITPIFPKIENKRSMIYIDNLSEFLKLVVDNQSPGVFFPQNTEYVNTSELAELVAKHYRKRLILTRVLNPYIKGTNINIFQKVFGDLVYEKEISDHRINYRVVDFKESIKLTEDNDA